MSSLTWGGYNNGQIPPTALAAVSNFVPLSGTHSGTTVLSNLLRADAAKQCKLLQAAFKAHFHKNLNVSEGYRTITTQRQYKADQSRTGVVAATPGTSIHGWALAVDFGSGVATYGCSNVRKHHTSFRWSEASRLNRGKITASFTIRILRPKKAKSIGAMC